MERFTITKTHRWGNTDTTISHIYSASRRDVKKDDVIRMANQMIENERKSKKITENERKWTEMQENERTSKKMKEKIKKMKGNYKISKKMKG